MKPPIGLKPRSIHEEERKQEILEAMQRFNEAGERIPQDWIDELTELNHPGPTFIDGFVLTADRFVKEKEGKTYPSFAWVKKGPTPTTTYTGNGRKEGPLIDPEGNIEVWSEGYLATGMEGVPAGANFEGRVKAESFQEACDKILGHRDDYNRDKLTLWGCRLFDNEQAARRSFG